MRLIFDTRMERFRAKVSPDLVTKRIDAKRLSDVLAAISKRAFHDDSDIYGDAQIWRAKSDVE